MGNVYKCLELIVWGILFLFKRLSKFAFYDKILRIKMTGVSTPV